MPIPEPRKNEKESAFVSRCMTFLDEEDSRLPHEQKLAACYASYRQAKKDGFVAEEVAIHSNAVWEEGRLHWNNRSRSGRSCESVLRCPTLDDPIPEDKADLKQP